MRIVTFTSLAPNINRKIKGVNVGLGLQEICFRAAERSLGTVYSVNYDQEISVIKNKYPSIKMVSAGSFESSPFPYPLVEFSLVQEVFSTKFSEDFVAIINSDVLLDNIPDDIFRILREEKKAFIMIGRREVENLSTYSDIVYLHGFDLVIMPRNLFLNLTIDGLAWGVPWWDYALPILARLSGANLYIATSADLRHFTHNVNWSKELWAMGLNAFWKSIKRMNLSENPLDFYFSMLIEYIINDNKGHENDAMLYTGGTLFARSCLKFIYENSRII